MTGITHLTFDCYGTLIDWERGILAAVQPLLRRHRVSVASEAILRSYVRHEAQLEVPPWIAYRDVLRGVMRGMSADLGYTLAAGEEDLLVHSLADWPPFPDTIEALRGLARRYRLGILSNIDDDLFARTQEKLQMRFDVVITAEQVKSYKPGPAHFQEALRRLGVPIGQILHVAQSLYHDHVPASQLGFHTAWINRPSVLPATGLAPTATARAELTAPDLATLATRLLS